MFKFTAYWEGRDEERLFPETIACQMIADDLQYIYNLVQSCIQEHGTEKENVPANAADREQFLEWMNQVIPHENSGLDSGKTAISENEEGAGVKLSSLNESRLQEIDTNNRKAKAILGCIVHAVQLADEDRIDMSEMVLAAYDYVARNDKILSQGLEQED